MASKKRLCAHLYGAIEFLSKMVFAVRRSSGETFVVVYVGELERDPGCASPIFLSHLDTIGCLPNEAVKQLLPTSTLTSTVDENDIRTAAFQIDNARMGLRQLEQLHMVWLQLEGSITHCECLADGAVGAQGTRVAIARLDGAGRGGDGGRGVAHGLCRALELE